MRLLSLVIVVLFACELTLAQREDSAAGKEPCPDTVPSKGKYVNYSYGFAILIPNGARGEWNSARCVEDKQYGCVCMSDHGRIIPLATKPDDADHWIEAYAGFPTALDEPTLANAVDERLNWIRERSSHGSVTILSRSDVTIGGAKSRRMVVRYYDKQLKRLMVEDFVEVLRRIRNVDVEYSLHLRSPVQAYELDKPMFEQVLRSFEFKNCDNC